MGETVFEGWDDRRIVRYVVDAADRPVHVEVAGRWWLRVAECDIGHRIVEARIAAGAAATRAQMAAFGLDALRGGDLRALLARIRAEALEGQSDPRLARGILEAVRRLGEVASDRERRSAYLDRLRSVHETETVVGSRAGDLRAWGVAGRLTRLSVARGWSKRWNETHHARAVLEVAEDLWGAHSEDRRAVEREWPELVAAQQLVARDALSLAGALASTVVDVGTGDRDV